MKARLLVFVSLWLVVAGAVVFAPGCYGRECEGDYIGYGVDGGEGQMISDTIWESSPTVGPWLYFPGQRGYSFDIRALGGRTPIDWTVHLSAASEPFVGGSKNSGNTTAGAGNIALVQFVGPNHIDIYNDTCSDYYVRLVVYVAPFPPAAEGAAPPPPLPTDAGTDAGDAATP